MRAPGRTLYDSERSCFPPFQTPQLAEKAVTGAGPSRNLHEAQIAKCLGREVLTCLLQIQRLCLWRTKADLERGMGEGQGNPESTGRKETTMTEVLQGAAMAGSARTMRAVMTTSRIGEQIGKEPRSSEEMVMSRTLWI